MSLVYHPRSEAYRNEFILCVEPHEGRPASDPSYQQVMDFTTFLITQQMDMRLDTYGDLKLR